jgi:hypothetical protein
MPKTHAMKEVEVLQFFEEAPIEKAETVFNIVSGKMRTRRSAKMPEGRTVTKRQSRRVIPEPGATDPALHVNPA